MVWRYQAVDGGRCWEELSRELRPSDQYREQVWLQHAKLSWTDGVGVGGSRLATV